ncbi:hypothetical protein Nepgr_026059 [Nepenthes gracilis]|uniref:Uncharacterized protein n=1 Tax=Nepenthes gracilis TaxID=150966 RepID=A0AAD3T939_NEPGR|nr:hypothetical protein Nepgr_026059 [Nepenthes gracilis]
MLSSSSSPVPSEGEVAKRPIMPTTVDQALLQDPSPIPDYCTATIPFQTSLSADPEVADVHEATANEREAHKSIGNSDPLEPSSALKMNLAGKANEESFADPLDNSLSKLGDALELNPPPSFAIAKSKLVLDEASINYDAEDHKQQRVQGLSSPAPFAAKAPVASPNACSIPSSIEQTHSFGKHPSDVLHDAVDSGFMDAESGQKPRDWHVLNSSPKLIPASLPFLEMQESGYMHLMKSLSDHGGMSQ